MAQSNSTILIEENAGIMTIVLNRPEVHNAFNEVMIAELIAAIYECKRRPDLRLLVLRAYGKSFSAGADLHWMQRMVNYSLSENEKDAGALAELMFTLYQLNKPTIAVIEGAAYGGGVGLVACCDLVLATPKASFCLSEVKLGLIPAIISPYVVAAIGERATRRYALTAERFTAEEAKNLQLVSEIVSEENLNTRLEELSNQLLQNGPKAMASCKALLSDIKEASSSEEVRELTIKTIATVRVSDEGQEGLAAFLEKRPAKWQ